MPKVKPELRFREDEALEARVAQELAEQVLVEPETSQPLLPCEIAAMERYASESTAEEKRVQTETDLIEQSKARIAALFKEASAEAPKAPEMNASAVLRREAITELVQLGWKHSDAVMVANRVQELLEIDDDLGTITYVEAMIVAQQEFEAKAPPKVRAPREAEPALPSVDEEPEPGCEIPTGDKGELVQIVHNLQRDIVRLVRLLGMEGVKKTRRKGNG